MNTHYSNRKYVALFFSLAAAVSCCGDGLADGYRWVDTPGKFMDLLQDDRPVLRYMYARLDKSSEQSRFETYKVFHHLYDPAGTVLLTNGPTGEVPYSKDVLYPHHRGLFFGFNRITYGNGKKADTWHMGHGESQHHVAVLASGGDQEKGWHRVGIDWRGQDGEVFANEERKLAVTSRESGTQVDFVSVLNSAIDGVVHLDGDPQHAGFQFRASDEVAKKTNDQTCYLRTDGKGKLGETRNWDHKNLDAPQNQECTDRPWNAMFFVVGGKQYSALYMDHPENPKPARYSERDYGRFGSYFVHDLKPGEPLIVQYRLWIQEGEITVDSATTRCREFVHSTKRSAEDFDPN